MKPPDGHPAGPLAIYWRPLEDGREIVVVAQMYNFMLTIGPQGSGCYDSGW